MSSSPIALSDSPVTDWYLVNRRIDQPTTIDLSARITKAASKQTYYTIRFLVDRDRIADAYRTYAYFRWVDDRLDEGLSQQSERLAFLERQQTIMHYCYQGESLPDLSPEEQMLDDLIRGDTRPNSGLGTYIRHMMAVMAFDAQRRWQLVSDQQLHDYTQHLAVAVTEAMHYFIGHDHFAPQTCDRYCAVTGAHIVHMLRDTFDDIEAGYFNVPREFLQAHHITITDVNSPAYRAWVQSRVEAARTCFKTGEDYLALVENRRCRIAGYAYLARFQGVLEAITREGYGLRRAYQERKSLSGGLRMAGSLLSMLVTA